MKNNIFYNIPLLVVLFIAGYLYTGASWVGGFLGFTTGIIALYDNNRRKILRDKDEKIKLLNDCVNLLLVTNDFENKEKIIKELDIEIKTSSSFHCSYDYYKDGYPTDLDIFKKACPSYKYANGSKNQSFLVQDLTFLKENDHVLLKERIYVLYGY